MKALKNATRFLLVSLSMSAFAASAFAATSLIDRPVTAPTRGDVERICAGLTGNKVMRGDFAQRKDIKSLSRAFTGNGTFVISQDDGILWNTQKPFPSFMAVTGDKIIQTTPQGKSSVLDAGQNPIFTQFADTIHSVFSGNASTLFAHFTVYYLPSKDGEWQIGLIPKDSVIRSVISSMTLKGKTHLDHFRMEEPSGDTVQYDFSNQTYSGDLTDAERKQFAK